MTNENYKKIEEKGLQNIAQLLDHEAYFSGASQEFSWAVSKVLPDVFISLKDRFNLIVDRAIESFKGGIDRSRGKIKIAALRVGSDSDSKICGLRAYITYFPIDSIKEITTSATWNDALNDWELDKA